MEQKAVLFSEMTPAADWEANFNAWYDDEHIPLRMGVPGFAGAQRYRRNERDYLVVYDMDDADVLASQAYGRVKNNPSEETAWMLKSVDNFTRYIGVAIGQQANVSVGEMLQAPVLYPVFFTVPADRTEEFDRWYDEDHVPTLLAEKSWLGCRRFEIISGEPGQFNRLALHYLASTAALDSYARVKARESEWRAQLAKQNWFNGTYMIFERHGERFKGAQ